jgi:HAD superfamily hydrolase (TIGR01509 family)
MPAVKAVVFDMDGLMFNTEDVYTSVGGELLGRRGREFTAELKTAMMGLPPRPSFEAMIRACGLSESWEALSAESNEIFLAMLPGRLSMLPGLSELLDALERASIPKAIATSSARRLAEACLAPFDLARRFRFILTAEDIARGKPHPEIYQTAARRFGAPPQEMLVLEDSQNGCRAAAAAGAFAVAVPGEHSRGQDFSVARLVIDGLGDPRLYAALGLEAKT